MQYGRFDDEAREYIIERPDTPRPWSNYLGDTVYGAIVTHHGGGYSFYRSSGVGRFLRLRTNSVPLDQPGRLIYLRDEESGRAWSATWMPMPVPVDEIKFEARHGLGYTVVSAEVDGIASEVTYFVPLGQHYEIWRVRVMNRSDRPRTLSAFTFCEFTSNWSIAQDLLNIQYIQYITQADWNDDGLQVRINANLGETPDDFTNNDQGRFAWMRVDGLPIADTDADRDAFLGLDGGYHDPVAVRNGRCSGSVAYGDNAAGSARLAMSLAPGESTEFVVRLGVGHRETHGRQAIAALPTSADVENALNAVREHWHQRIDGVRVMTPDPDFDHMVNVWNPYNSLITFAWSRSASLIYNADRDGYGYRDTVQDLVGAAASIPDEVGERLALMLTGQLAHGGAMPVVRPYAHRPGHEPETPAERLRSDDTQWLFDAVEAYLGETGDTAFLDRELPFADTGSATVFGHLRRALEFNLERRGAHGLACGLEADWNDCLKLGYHGESVMVTQQLRRGLGRYAQWATRRGESDEAAWAWSQLVEVDRALDESAWDGAWFRWAIGEDGTVYGTATANEGRVYLNTQVWAVLAGAGTADQQHLAMDAVNEHLASEFGVALCAPAWRTVPVDVMRAVLFNPGTKENGGIFSHTQSWAVLAECRLGRGDRAHRYYRAFLPAAQNDRGEVRQVEPYVHCQSTHGPESPRFGTSRLPWLSGTASWACYAATQGILGIRPVWDGLAIDPCLPPDWSGFSMERRFRGRWIHITVRQEGRVMAGVTEIRVDGEVHPGQVIPAEHLHEGSRIEVTVGPGGTRANLS